MIYKITRFLIMNVLVLINTVQAQTITTVPNDVVNDRYLAEYFPIIRPGLSFNGFDNTGSTSFGLGLKQTLNQALSGDIYFKNKLNTIFGYADDSLITNSPTDRQIEDNSLIIQYTAFEALASYVLEHNGIDTSQSLPLGLNIRTHEDAIADLRAKLIFISELNSSGGFHGIYHFQINTWFHMITG